MSKKKKAAKLARAEERRGLLERRTQAAIATFVAEFPSPYTSDEEERDDRELCRRVRTDSLGPTEDEEPMGLMFLRQAEDDSYVFAAWVHRYRDEMTTRYSSQQLVEPRVRFQLAQLVRSDVATRKGFHPDVLRIARVMVQQIPLFTGLADPGWADDWLTAVKAPHEDLANPYTSDGELEADLDLVRAAWKRHYGLDPLPDDFCPPFFVTDDEGMAAAPWCAVLRDLLVEKYGSLELVEPRWRILLQRASQSAIERRGERIIDFGSEQQRTAFDDLLDRL